MMRQSPTEQADRIDAFLIGAAFGVITTTMVIITFAKIYW